MRRLKFLLAALALLLGLAVVVPFLIPLGSYIPRVENLVSAKLGEPVSIKSIRLSVLPLPHVTVQGVTIGAAGEINVGAVRVTPDLMSLLRETKVVRSVEIDTLHLTQKAIDKIPLWTGSLGGKPAGGAPLVRVERIGLESVTVDFAKAKLGPLDARVILSDGGAPQAISVTSQDGKLKLAITPDGPRYLIDLSAKGWTLPAGPPVVFDELAVKGEATAAGADLSRIGAKLYGGTVDGKATVAWGKGLRLKGNLDVNQVEMRQIAAMLSPKTHVSGRLAAKPVFSASAASADQLMNALRLETPFNVQNGVIYGVDIQKAATALIKQGSTGGETRFEHLSGHLILEHRAYHFSQLQVSSGALAVAGNVSISSHKALSGRIDAQVNAVGTSAKVPLNVAGTLDMPLLYPPASFLAGAAAGTAILGPGAGTSVGAKLGGWAESLLKGDK